MLFAADASNPRTDVLEWHMPRRSLNQMRRLGLDRLSVRSTNRPEIALVRCAHAAPVVRELSSGVRTLAGVPSKYVLGSRHTAVGVVVGALLAAPLEAHSGEWRVRCPTGERALALAGLFRRCGVAARSNERKGLHIVRIPSSEEAALLALNVEVPKLRSRASKAATGHATLDEINERRRAEQEHRTRAALRRLGQECPPGLRAAAELRLRYPDLSVEALGLMMNPPQSRHAVNGQLRRLHEMAERLPKEQAAAATPLK